MNYYLSDIWQILILIAFLGLGVLFLWNQQKALTLVRPEYRRMPPGQVWLQLIPLFGLYWQFMVVGKIADSIRNDLNAPKGDSLFGEDPANIGERPTYGPGITYCTLFCISILPLGFIKNPCFFSGPDRMDRLLGGADPLYEMA